jgi:phosphoglucosamine mutase
VVFLKNTFPRDLDLIGLKIVLDCAHGAAYKVAPAVLEELGAEVITLGVSPNGTNINKDCGSLHPEGIAAAVKTHGADLGIALDGDADRVIFVDGAGNQVDGDHIMAICATDMIHKGSLAHQTLVATVMSNLGLEIAMRAAGGTMLRTDVGDRYVVEEMRRGGFNLGGEQSGHMIFLDHNTTGDGMLSALQVLAIMQRSGRSLADLAKVMTALPQVLVNVRVAARKKLKDVPVLKQLIADTEQKLGDEGRVLIRYSGTEPLLRIMLEGQDKEYITRLANEIAATVTRELGGGQEGE